MIVSLSLLSRLVLFNNYTDQHAHNSFDSNPTQPIYMLAENIGGPTGPSIAVNSPPDIVRERELTHLPTVPHILANGIVDAITESDNAFGRMAESTRENGGMVRHMGTGWKNEPTGRYDMKGIGMRMCRSGNDDVWVCARASSHNHSIRSAPGCAAVFQLCVVVLRGLSIGPLLSSFSSEC